jgi:hypothetical protein
MHGAEQLLRTSIPRASPSPPHLSNRPLVRRACPLAGHEHCCSYGRRSGHLAHFCAGDLGQTISFRKRSLIALFASRLRCAVSLGCSWEERAGHVRLEKDSRGGLWLKRDLFRLEHIRLKRKERLGNPNANFVRFRDVDNAPTQEQ